MIEFQHQPQQQPTPERRQHRLSPSPQTQHGRQPAVTDMPDEAFVGDFPAPHQLSQDYGVDLVNPVEQDHQGRYIRRNSGLDDSPYQLPRRAQTFDSADVFDERNTYRSQPQVVRPRAVSPNAGQMIPRKSVSPHPQASGDRRRLSAVPFSPDSYEAYNSGSDDVFGTPAGDREAARQKEVQKIRDQGPIIGNDGRVIDPSDHLPSDTWAPEPERKERKPEHVIRIRTRDEARNGRAGSSPLPARPVSFQPTPPQSYQSSPQQSPIEPPNSGRRNRLQKQSPVRPLPTQPFAHPQSSPASIPQIDDFRHTPPHHQQPIRNNVPSSPAPNQRHSMYNTPPSAPPSDPRRPPLSEYQVPTTNSYSPRGSYYPPSTTPTKVPPAQRPQSYAHNGYDDPLAAELSMIDIGPSRGGRTALRSNRGYSAY